jgi:hypothetical protein
MDFCHFSGVRCDEVGIPSFVMIVPIIMAHRHSDKSGERYWHIAVPLAFGIIGFVIAAATMNTAARYISLLVVYKSSASNPLSFYVPTTGF